MSALNVIVDAATRLAEGDDRVDLSSLDIGPGALLAPAVLGVLVVFLGIAMVRRLRRSAYRAEARAKVEAELAEQGGADASPQGAPDEE